jgi:ribonuclease HII
VARFRLGPYILSTFGASDWRRFRLCGMDEVGRGAFAGPLVAAAVVLPPGFRHPWLRDSKRLTPRQREVVAATVHRRALACEIVEIPASEINTRGLGWANKEVFRRLAAAIDADGYCCDGRLRIDAVHTVHTLVGGDDLVPAISAASIVAKVHRDALMRELHLDAPVYGWASNKGYGAPEHRAAILAHGLHRQHRYVFVDSLLQLDLGLELGGPPSSVLEAVEEGVAARRGGRGPGAAGAGAGGGPGAATAGAGGAAGPGAGALTPARAEAGAV